MATIKVRVQGEIATNLTPEVRLVCQNEKYDVEFEFDESWSDSNFKTALFIYNGKSIAVPFDREKNVNVCKIPALYDTELLHIGVKSNDIDGLHTSTPARVGCLLSANDIANGEIPDPTPSQYEEIIRLVNEYVAMDVPSTEDIEEIASSIVEEKINALINGADESFDTLKEIADWIKEHPKSVAELNSKIQANTEKILANESAIANLNNLVELLESEKQNKSDNGLNTSSKMIVGAINEINEKVLVLGKNGLTENKVKEIIQQTAVTKETDPSVPSWAKQPKKPTYTAQEVGALPSDTPLFSGDYNDLTNKPKGLASEEYVNQKADFLSAEITAINTVLEQSGIVTKYKSTIEDTYNERITAGGLNVLDGSLAKLEKVVGSTVKCNNLIPFPYRVTGGSLNGIDYSISENGEITFNGTATADFSVRLTNGFSLSAGTYTLTGCPNGGGTTTYYLQIGYMLNGVYKYHIDRGNVATFTIDSAADSCNILVYIRNGQTVSNLVFKPMLNEGETALPYQKYFEGLKNASFAGIESKNADGTEVSMLNFTETELGEWDEIDFEKQKVVRGGEELTQDTAFTEEQLAEYDDYIISADRKTIRYKLATFMETPFTEEQSANGNEYRAYSSGTERVLGNDNAEYGVKNTLSQNYIIVTGVK